MSVSAEEITYPSLVCPVYKTVSKLHMSTTKMPSSFTHTHNLPSSPCVMFSWLCTMCFSQSCLSLSCVQNTCVLYVHVSSIIRGCPQVTKSDTRPPLFILCSRLSTFSTTFSFILWTMNRFQVKYTVDLFKRHNKEKSACQVSLTKLNAEDITTAHSRKLDQQ